MRTVSVRLADLAKTELYVGYVGENLHTRVIIDASKMFEQYPTAAVAMTVQPPFSEAYPAVVERQGNDVIWDVTDSDLIRQGNGEIQLAFTVDEIVAKTFVGRIRIGRSIIPTGEIPDPLDDFLTRAGAALTGIPQTIDNALAAAKASGEFDGKDGEDGYSPTATVTKSGKTATITITDKNGTTTETVSDGEDGAPGTTDYTELDNKPSIAGVTLSGNKSLDDLGIAAKTDTVLGSTLSMGRKANTTIGVHSVATGVDVEASGNNAHAEGSGTIASGMDAHAEGGGTVASGIQSHAEGAGSSATSNGAHAEGAGTTASGLYAHAEGAGTTASGFSAHAEGSGTASGSQAHAEGAGSSATSVGAHAEGGGTTASGNVSHAEGNYTIASATAAHAEGSYTVAAGNDSHVVGKYNVADSYDNWNEWTANTAYVVGDKVKRTTTSNGNTTVTGYICKTANSDSSFTASKWTNQYGYMNYAEIVGNGTADNARSNARTLDWSGNEELAGDLTIRKGTADEVSVSTLKNAINAKVGFTDYATSETAGVVKPGQSIGVNSSGVMGIIPATISDMQNLYDGNKAITPLRLANGVFFALSKVAGEDLKDDSGITIGEYPEKSLAAIHQMLDAPISVSGSTPSITAKSGVRYVCGEVSTLTIVVPASGCIDVVFKSGSTAAVLTITPPTGKTVKWANGFDPTALEANTTYELNIMDLMGVAGSWT